MSGYNMTAEYMSLALLAVLFLHQHLQNRRQMMTRRRNLFGLCLIVPACCVGLNELCTLQLETPGSAPLGFMWLCNSLYFWCGLFMCSLLCYYMGDVLTAHVYDKSILSAYKNSIKIIMAVMGVALAANAYTGVLFSIDSSYAYHRGPLNVLGYVFMGVEVLLCVGLYVRHKNSISEAVRNLLLTLVCISAILVVVQVSNPSLCLNSTMAALVDLCIILNGQNGNNRDTLTGLLNRNTFTSDLELHLRGREKSQILYVSLKNFAEVNQHYGHQTADNLLYEVAQYLRGFHGQGGAYRFRSATFTLILPGEDALECAKRLQQLQARFREEWIIGTAHCRLSAYIVEMQTVGGESGEQVVETLEYGYNVAKEEQTDVVRCNSGVLDSLMEKKEMLALLQKAIRDQRFEVWYQPVMNCNTGKYSTAEALMRMHDDQGRIVPPSRFVTLAEETGLIEEISWIVLEEICRFLSGPNHGEIQAVSWNLSQQMFNDPNLANRVLRKLDQYDLPVQALRAEVTERMLLYDETMAEVQLRKLHAAGIRLYLDDFGTGYSNFAGVLKLPLDVIKVDRSLVMNIETDEQSARMLRTVIDLFHGMGKTLVVEGVETGRQAEIVRSYGANYIQGFYYSRPMPQQNLMDFLEKEQARRAFAAGRGIFTAVTSRHVGTEEKNEEKNTDKDRKKA